MKIVSIRLTRRRLAAMVVAAALLILALLLLLPDRDPGPAAETAQQRADYLRSLGLEPVEGSESVQTVRIPGAFSGLYLEYQAM